MSLLTDLVSHTPLCPLLVCNQLVLSISKGFCPSYNELVPLHVGCLLWVQVKEFALRSCKCSGLPSLGALCTPGAEMRLRAQVPGNMGDPGISGFVRPLSLQVCPAFGALVSSSCFGLSGRAGIVTPFRGPEGTLP